MSTTTKSQKRARRRRRFGKVFPRPGGPKGAWLIQYPDPEGTKTASGRTRYLTKSVGSEAEGKALLGEIEKAVLLGQFVAPTNGTAPACNLTLMEAITEYLTAKRAEGKSENGIKRYGVSQRAIAMSPLADRRAADLSPRDIESYQAWRRQRKWLGVRKLGSTRKDPNQLVRVKGGAPSNASINRDIALVSAAINRLVRLGLLQKNPVGRIKRGKEPVRTRAILSKEECSRLIDGCADYFRPFALAALLTGQRPCELKALLWGDVSFGNQTITVYRPKVGVGDTIHMHSMLAAELQALKKRRGGADDHYVFLSSTGKPEFEYRWAWRSALRAAGLDRRKGLTFYSLRHTFATHYLERGAPADLQQILGHASYTTTARYVRAMSERARKGIEGLDVMGAGKLG